MVVGDTFADGKWNLSAGGVTFTAQKTIVSPYDPAATNTLANAIPHVHRWVHSDCGGSRT